jgi:hypothetical protein
MSCSAGIKLANMAAAQVHPSKDNRCIYEEQKAVAINPDVAIR